MKIDLIENAKNRLKFTIQGEGHSFCNILRKELWHDKNVDIGGYYVEHSLLPEPVFTIQTTKSDPKKALLQTIDRLHKLNKELKETFAKL